MKLSEIYNFLDQLSPLRTLNRGYSYTTSPTGQPLRQLADFQLNQEFKVHLTDGIIQAKVLQKEQADDNK